MVLALSACAVVACALAIELCAPRQRIVPRRVAGLRARIEVAGLYHAEREQRAEQRAAALLRSCIDPEDWEMYRELGFLRVWGRATDRPRTGGVRLAAEPRYAYLIYPHKPIVAYVPQRGRLLSEYCVAFSDPGRPCGGDRLPPSDDVLAKWLALSADERGLIAVAHLHLAGHQLEPARVRRDLVRLRVWERGRVTPPLRSPGSVPRL